MLDEAARAKYALYLGIFITFLGYTGNYAGMGPYYSQFFPFAAWSYILLADNLAWRLNGSSPLVSRTGEFLFLAAWSAALAALAEFLNLRLGAWSYVNQSPELSVRWAGRLFSWAAVLPSLFITAELLGRLPLFRAARTRAFTLTPGMREGVAWAGMLALMAAAAFPGLAWPLAVPGLFLLAESADLKLGLPSLLRELAGGLPSKSLRLAAAGPACGALWNFWNGAAGSRFELSLPGFLPSWAAYAALPFLSAGAYSLYALASWVRSGKSWEEGEWTVPGGGPGQAQQAVIAGLLILSFYFALRAVDAYTVKFYLGWA